jgi:hypothetical protein
MDKACLLAGGRLANLPANVKEIRGFLFGDEQPEFVDLTLRPRPRMKQIAIDAQLSVG